MECWTQNSWRTQKNHQDVKSNSYDKQTDDFLETFPNFMTLTDEERREFFQTLHAAKVKLENSGVTVKPFFGTVHDQSWNNLEALNINGKPNTDNEAFTSPRSETDASLSNKPASLKSKISVNRFSPAYSGNSVKRENSEKPVKESGTHPAFSQENLESVLGTNDSLESLGFEEKEVEVTSFNSSCKNNVLENSKKSVISSLSYEILNKNERSPLHHQEKDDTLKITGTKLKVQVTLTSGDKEKMKVLRKPKKFQIDEVMPNNVEFSGKGNCPKGDKKMGFFELKFDGTSTESINDPEIENLLNVDDDSLEELQEEKEKSRPEITCKRSFDEDKIKEKKGKAVNKNVLGKAVTGKKELSRHSFQDQILLEKERGLMNAVSENDKQRTLPRRSKTTVTVAKVKPKKEQKTNVKEQSDKKTEISKCNSNVSKNGKKTNVKEENDNRTEIPKCDSIVSKNWQKTNVKEENDNRTEIPKCDSIVSKNWQKTNVKEENDNKTEIPKCDSILSKNGQKANIKELNDDKTELPKTNSNESKKNSSESRENSKATQRNLSEVTTAMEGAGSNTRLEMQETEVSVKDKAKLKMERQVRLEKLRKNLQRRENFYPRKLKRKNEKSTASTKKSTNEEEVQTEENPNPAWANPDIKEKKLTKIPCDSEKKKVTTRCTTQEMKRAKVSAETGKTANFVPTPVPSPAPVETSVTEKKKVVKGGQVLGSKKGNLEEVKECNRPFKEGKVIFVDDNVIEKIKNVIMDLEKKAKAEDCTENEYLVLVVEYVEYLSTVMATLFEDRILNTVVRNPSVRFDEENLKEIQKCLQLSTSTTEYESEYNERKRRSKKYKRNKPKKPSFIRRLKKIFNCGKNRKRKKAAGSSSDSSP